MDKITSFIIIILCIYISYEYCSVNVIEGQDSDPGDKSRAGASGRRPGSGSGPTVGDSQSQGQASAGNTGGYSYDSGGREGFGYGLKKGGLVSIL